MIGFFLLVKFWVEILKLLDLPFKKFFFFDLNIEPEKDLEVEFRFPLL